MSHKNFAIAIKSIVLLLCFSNVSLTTTEAQDPNTFTQILTIGREAGGVSISPDDEHIAINGENTLWIYDMTLTVIAEYDLLLREEDAVILVTQWSPDGERLALGVSQGIAGMIIILDTTTWSHTHTFETSVRPSVFTWHPNSSQIVTLAYAGYSGAIEIFDLIDTSTSIVSDSFGSSTVGVESDIAWHPDGSRILIGDVSGTVHNYDVASGIISLILEIDFVQAIAWRPDGSEFAVVQNDMTAIYDAESNTPIGRSTSYVGFNLAWRDYGISLSGRSVVVLSDDLQEVIYDADANATTTFGAVISHDGTFFINFYGNYEKWDIATNSLSASFGYEHFSYVQDIDWSPTDSLLATLHRLGGIRVWDTTTGDLIYSINPRNNSMGESITFSPDGNQIAYNYDQTVRIWDLSTQSDIATIPVSDSVLFFAWNPVTGKLAGLTRDTLYLWDVHSETIVATYDMQNVSLRSTSIQFSPSGEFLFVAGGIDEATIHNATDLSVTSTLPLNNGFNQIVDGAWSPDSNELVTQDSESLISVWSATGTQVRNYSLTGIAPTWQPSVENTMIVVQWSPSVLTDELIFLDSSQDEIIYKQTVNANIVELVWSPDGSAYALHMSENQIRIYASNNQ